MPSNYFSNTSNYVFTFSKHLFNYAFTFLIETCSENFHSFILPFIKFTPFRLWPFHSHWPKALCSHFICNMCANWHCNNTNALHCTTLTHICTHANTHTQTRTNRHNLISEFTYEHFCSQLPTGSRIKT